MVPGATSSIVTSFLSTPLPISLPFHRVHPLKKASSPCVHSQCAVHSVVGTLSEQPLHSRRVPWTWSSSSSLVSLLTNSRDPWILESTYQPTPILHEQDSQNTKSPLQSAGALFNLRVNRVLRLTHVVSRHLLLLHQIYLSAR
jgi:hypothetical protein